jgi:flagellar protein FliT
MRRSEKASQDMLEAARAGNSGSQARRPARCCARQNTAEAQLPPDEAEQKSLLMQRILVNDAEIRQLAEPWLEDLDDILAGRPKTLH